MARRGDRILMSKKQEFICMFAFTVCLTGCFVLVPPVVAADTVGASSGSAAVEKNADLDKTEEPGDLDKPRRGSRRSRGESRGREGREGREGWSPGDRRGPRGGPGSFEDLPPHVQRMFSDPERLEEFRARRDRRRTDWEKDDPELFKAANEEREQRKKLGEIARQYHETKSEAEKKKLAEQIETESAKMFDIQTVRHQLMIERMRKRLEGLEKTFEKRETRRAELIKRDVEKTLKNPPPPPRDPKSPDRRGHRSERPDRQERSERGDRSSGAEEGKE